MECVESCCFGAVSLVDYPQLHAKLDSISKETRDYFRHWQVYARKNMDPFHIWSESNEWKHRSYGQSDVLKTEETHAKTFYARSFRDVFVSENVNVLLEKVNLHFDYEYTQINGAEFVLKQELPRVGDEVDEKFPYSFLTVLAYQVAKIPNMYKGDVEHAETLSSDFVLIEVRVVTPKNDLYRSFISKELSELIPSLSKYVVLTPTSIDHL